jgi:hypothetical protein
MNTQNNPNTRWSRTSGQALPLFVVFVVVLILFVGLGIDLGFAYVTKATLSKAVDAAALEGMLIANQGSVTATAIAKSVFAANYGRPGRDTAAVVPTVSITTDALGHQLVNVSATARINTFFIRVLPVWKTLQVSANAQAKSRRLIMSLVLDRSGSMTKDGGSTVLPPAVTNFVSYFDDTRDYVSLNSFSKWASTDVTIRHNFKAPITAAVAAMNFNDNTVSEQGMTNGLAQNESVPVTAGDDVIKVIVFFTDGLANGFKQKLNCGPQNISNPGGSVSANDPVTGADSPVTCTIPASIQSINPSYTKKANISTSSCSDMHAEAEARALAIAKLARQSGNIVYSVALNNGAYSECYLPSLNTDFLKDMANTKDSDTYDASQPDGKSFVADDPSDLLPLFDLIRADILLRLTQ